MALGAGLEIEGPFESMLQTLSNVMKQDPEHIAVKDLHGGQISYGGLMDRAIAISSELKSHGGVVQGTPVCVLGPPNIEFLCSTIGIWFTGGIYVPLDHQTSDKKAIIVQNCNAYVCIFSQADLVDRALQFDVGTVFDCADMALDEGHNNVDAPVSEDVAVAFHVAASNKDTKGIILTHRNAMSLAKAMNYYFEGEQPVVLQHSNWTCSLSLFQILFALTSGGTIVLSRATDSTDV
jgi:acyl-CoA synthetase (AMP-forming)/AMP-acid ligase II